MKKKRILLPEHLVDNHNDQRPHEVDRFPCSDHRSERATNRWTDEIRARERGAQPTVPVDFQRWFLRWRVVDVQSSVSSTTPKRQLQANRREDEQCVTSDEDWLPQRTAVDLFSLSPVVNPRPIFIHQHTFEKHLNHFVRATTALHGFGHLLGVIRCVRTGVSAQLKLSRAGGGIVLCGKGMSRGIFRRLSCIATIFNRMKKKLFVGCPLRHDRWTKYERWTKARETKLCLSSLFFDIRSK